VKDHPRTQPVRCDRERHFCECFPTVLCGGTAGLIAEIAYRVFRGREIGHAVQTAEKSQLDEDILEASIADSMTHRLAAVRFAVQRSLAPCTNSFHFDIFSSPTSCDKTTSGQRELPCDALFHGFSFLID
jgi:hypothetical protein